MKYTVVWVPSAKRDLANLWLAATDRQAVTAAANAIDAALKHDPLSCGESRGGDLRVFYSVPLAVLYQVLPADRKATVLAVWRPQN